jgi:hypothetical protein
MQVACVELLLASQADVQQSNAAGMSALMLAAQQVYEDTDIVVCGHLYSSMSVQ